MQRPLNSAAREMAHFSTSADNEPDIVFVRMLVAEELAASQAGNPRLGFDLLPLPYRAFTHTSSQEIPLSPDDPEVQKAAEAAHLRLENQPAD